MKKIILIIFFIFIGTFISKAQDFKTHKVQPGETIENIANQYLVTPFDIYALNPDAKSKLDTSTVLIIPITKVKNGASPLQTKKLIGYKKHRVRRKETLYSISKLYSISIEDIKKHNTFLYADNLKKGTRINIPRFKIIASKVSIKNTLRKYKVQPKEGKWRIAYKFGITIGALEKLNPNMGETLQVGEEINVPNIANNEEKSIEDNAYNYYKVLPKEGFYRLKVKLGLTQEELETLNPELKTLGLKQGMILKVPLGIDAVESPSHNNPATNLTNSLTNLSPKRLALMLPFRLNRVDTDSIQEAKELIKKDRRLSVSLDFHSGVLFALDSAKKLGISSHLKVFDTKDNLAAVSKILENNDFSNYDAVIGPLLPANFERVAARLKTKKVPVISPISKPKNLYDNVFQTLPNDELLKKSIINFVKADTLVKKIFIISDSKTKGISAKLKVEFPDAKQIFSRKDKKGKEQYNIVIADIENIFANGKNIVFLETENEGFASNVISMLNSSIQKNKEIVLCTTNKNKAFEGTNISNNHLSNLKFHYPSAYKSYDIEDPNHFIKQYKETYGVAPNTYAIRGFDLTLDLLLRLASYDDIYKSANEALLTEHIQNKFKYSKKFFGGFFNEAVYIVKYDDLRIVDAEL